MTKDELIVRISTELYDLKHKLELIRKISETACEDAKKEPDKEICNKYLYLSHIDVINEVDLSGCYDD